MQRDRPVAERSAMGLLVSVWSALVLCGLVDLMANIARTTLCGLQWERSAESRPKHEADAVDLLNLLQSRQK